MLLVLSFEMIKNLKIVELASVLAGPAVGQFFAELGAEVIKVENKTTGGDVTRSWKLSSENADKTDSAYFSSVNFGKQHHFSNFNDRDDLNELLELIKKADILIANFKSGDAEKFGLDFASIKLIHPNIIYGEIIGFPNSKRPAYDMVLQAETGWLSMNGQSASELVKIPVAIIDLFAAHQLKEGLLIALLQRKEGAQKVSVSLYESAISALANQATNWLIAQHEAKPMGLLHPNIAPYGELFQCKDNKALVLAIGSQKHFYKLCKAIGLEALTEDPRFKNNQARLARRAELSDLLEREFRKRTRAEWMDLFEKQSIPAGALNSISEVFEKDVAQKMILKQEEKLGLSQIAFHFES